MPKSTDNRSQACRWSRWGGLYTPIDTPSIIQRMRISNIIRSRSLSKSWIQDSSKSKSNTTMASRQNSTLSRKPRRRKSEVDSSTKISTKRQTNVISVTSQSKKTTSSEGDYFYHCSAPVRGSPRSGHDCVAMTPVNCEIGSTTQLSQSWLQQLHKLERMSPKVSVEDKTWLKSQLAQLRYKISSRSLSGNPIERSTARLTTTQHVSYQTEYSYIPDQQKCTFIPIKEQGKSSGAGAGQHCLTRSPVHRSATQGTKPSARDNRGKGHRGQRVYKNKSKKPNTLGFQKGKQGKQLCEKKVKKQCENEEEDKVCVELLEKTERNEGHYDVYSEDGFNGSNIEQLRNFNNEMFKSLGDKELRCKGANEYGEVYHQYRKHETIQCEMINGEYSYKRLDISSSKTEGRKLGVVSPKVRCKDADINRNKMADENSTECELGRGDLVEVKATPKMKRAGKLSDEKTARNRGQFSKDELGNIDSDESYLKNMGDELKKRLQTIENKAEGIPKCDRRRGGVGVRRVSRVSCVQSVKDDPSHGELINKLHARGGHVMTDNMASSSCHVVSTQSSLLEHKMAANGLTSSQTTDSSSTTPCTSRSDVTIHHLDSRNSLSQPSHSPQWGPASRGRDSTSSSSSSRLEDTDVITSSETSDTRTTSSRSEVTCPDLAKMADNGGNLEISQNLGDPVDKFSKLTDSDNIKVIDLSQSECKSRLKESKVKVIGAESKVKVIGAENQVKVIGGDPPVVIVCSGGGDAAQPQLARVRKLLAKSHPHLKPNRGRLRQQSSDRRKLCALAVLLAIMLLLAATLIYLANLLPACLAVGKYFRTHFDVE